VALSIGAQQVEIIREISAVYSLLQNCYSEWASNFSNHEDVIRWLEKENISTDKIRKRIRKQSRFNLHSSHWNGITISLIKKLAARNINELEGHFDSLFRAQSNENRRMMPIPLIPPCDSDGSRHRVPGEAAIPSERSDAGVWCFS
jgi:hypothetical protein